MGKEELMSLPNMPNNRLSNILIIEVDCFICKY